MGGVGVGKLSFPKLDRGSARNGEDRITLESEIQECDINVSVYLKIITMKSWEELRGATSLQLGCC